ncbi:cation diffusion facilitator family transporter [Chitinilyticum piscinae]|uniref:Cation transporter n=1 Tax=Chitinilyticum piscinae TaxID=2866724 RepID=A0A8J7K1U6_9NEIS|nr:cation diffusion facilitator family transporter [Chitinilyticum piscinae]MBE9609716.1 cation transporter [Chitinilyticum piscinae]
MSAMIETAGSASATERQNAARTSTLVSVVVNVLLTIVQIVVGILAKSQALVADGVHSLSDLLADFVVLFVNHHSHKDADDDHQYGHARFENAASLVLGVLLLVVGAGMLWTAADKLLHPEHIARVHPVALWVALLALAGKEGLFRYMLAVAKRVSSSMLIANAWHARSDAASSLVVAVGIVGNLLGYPLLDPLAALIVGIMVGKMGWEFSWDALHDLMDRALPADEVTAITATLAGTPGVLGVHDLRTRKMGDLAVIDAHIEVDPRISVTEGHLIAVRCHDRVMATHAVLNITVHVDPREECESHLLPLPPRDELACAVAAQLAQQAHQLHLHFVEGAVELDILLAETPVRPVDTASLRERFPALRQIRIFVEQRA